MGEEGVYCGESIYKPVLILRRTGVPVSPYLVTAASITEQEIFNNEADG